MGARQSPSGFNWGYGGSGPAQLALAILLRATDHETAVAYYQAFKWDVIAKLPLTRADSPYAGAVIVRHVRRSSRCPVPVAEPSRMRLPFPIIRHSDQARVH